MPARCGQAQRFSGRAETEKGTGTTSQHGKMNHLSEEQLILHYYGEEGDSLSTERHLEECEGCRCLYGGMQRVLNVVDSLPVPERSAEYGGQVWRRIEGRLPRLPVRRRAWWLLP